MTVETRTYRGLHLWGPLAPVTEADLEAVEAQLPGPLPPAYRDLLLEGSGGQLPYALTLPPGSAEGELIQLSDLFRADRLLEERAAYLAGSLPQVMPETLLPVARDGGDSTLYLDLADGSVWAVVMGLPGWAGGTGQSSGGRVADSWDAYLDLLAIDPDYARDVWEDRDGTGPEWVAALESWLDDALPGWRGRGWA